MMKRSHTKLIRENDYVAEVNVDLLKEDGPGAPYLSLADVYKLETVRDALRRNDPDSIQSLARVYKLTPLHAGA